MLEFTQIYGHLKMHISAILMVICVGLKPIYNVGKQVGICGRGTLIYPVVILKRMANDRNAHSETFVVGQDNLSPHALNFETTNSNFPFSHIMRSGGAVASWLVRSTPEQALRV